MSTSAASRLRSAFRYPSDSDDSDPSSPFELDEEHQERLIESLASEDAAKTSLYRNLFLAIPGSGALFFLYSFLVLAGSARERLFALLALSSLVGTGYILRFVPVKRESERKKGKRALYQVEADRGGPIERYLVVILGVLVGLLQLAAVVSWVKGDREKAYRESLPAVIFVLTMVVRLQLRPLDMEELQRSRYEFKGA
jgi:hypothetical protein